MNNGLRGWRGINVGVKRGGERRDWREKIRWKTVVRIHRALARIEVTSLLCADWLAVDGLHFLFLTEFGMFCTHFLGGVLILSTATDAAELSCMLAVSPGFLRWLTTWWKNAGKTSTLKFSCLFTFWLAEIEWSSFQGKFSQKKLLSYLRSLT